MVSASLVSFEASLFGLQVVTFLLCPHDFFLCMHILVSLYAQISSSYKDARQSTLESTYTILFNINYLFKDFISGCSHILMYWGLRLQQINLVGDKI